MWIWPSRVQIPLVTPVFFLRSIREWKWRSRDVQGPRANDQGSTNHQYPSTREAPSHKQGVDRLWQTNLTVSPSSQITLREQIAVAHERLNTFGNDVVTIVSFRQVGSQFVSTPSDYHGDLLPVRFGDGQDRGVNLGIVQSHKTGERVKYDCVKIKAVMVCERG